MVDPVTYKVFTDNTHIVAILNTGNVFAHDTVSRLNIKAKMWRDLVTDEEFGRKDIVTLQDPHNVEGRNLSGFKYLKEGVSVLTDEQRREREKGVNRKALGNAARVLKDNPPPAKPQIGKYMHSQPASSSTTKTFSNTITDTPAATAQKPPATTKPPNPHTTAHHTTGLTAASFTSTGLTPSTTSALALLSTEESLLKPRLIKPPGYAHLHTTHGQLTLTLLPEFAPRAVWNFIQLSKRGYYDTIPFHRSVRNFMLQGGDPTGTGRGGESVWGKTFNDELDGPRSHDKRGVLSMANKGKNTNSSQFFITYRACTHLDRKHTIFGKVVGGWEVLDAIEDVDVDESSRPVSEIRIESVSVFVDPFEEFVKEREEREERERVEEEVRKKGGREEERVTWTGKRVRRDGGGVEGEGAGVGRYLGGGKVDGSGKGNGNGELLEEWEREEPVKKKVKGEIGGGVGGFGNFDGW